MFGLSTSFCEVGRQVAKSLTLNRRQSIAFWLICRQLDQVRRDEHCTSQLCLFIGGEGSTSKSRVITAIAELFARRSQSHRLLVTATSGTAAANINRITIHSACKFSKDTSTRTGRAGEPDGFAPSSSAGLRIDGQAKMDWQEKYALIIDEISMLGARTLYAVNEQPRRLRESTEDFGDIPLKLPMGARPRLRSRAAKATRRRPRPVEEVHRGVLKEQVRAAQDPGLRRLLTRVRQGAQDQSDVEFLNSNCYHEGRRIPWESGITVVTPLNRNRWNLNVEATLAVQRQRHAPLHIFVSKHKWKDGEPTEEEAVMMLGQGDDSAISVPAVFMFVPGMPVVVNQNMHQGLKLVNGARYEAVGVVLDKAYPGHRINAEMACRAPRRSHVRTI
ncbi:hypothetical protein IL306_007181, partial [Fusarium sp. DS 682]